MGFLKQLLNKYVNSGHGNKHGGGYGKQGGKHGYSQSPYTNYENPIVNNMPGKLCVSCNTNNLRDAKFCQQCGTSLLPSECSQCKTVLANDAKFCPQCGKGRT